MKVEREQAKATANAKKHGVTFEEALTVFYDPVATHSMIPITRGVSGDSSPWGTRCGEVSWQPRKRRTSRSAILTRRRRSGVLPR